MYYKVVTVLFVLWQKYKTVKINWKYKPVLMSRRVSVSRASFLKIILAKYFIIRWT